jgi:hypothetical protein
MIKIFALVFLLYPVLQSEVAIANPFYQDDTRFQLNPGKADSPRHIARHKTFKAKGTSELYRIQVLAEPIMKTDIKSLEGRCHQSNLIIEKHKGLFKYLSAPLTNHAEAIQRLKFIRSYQGFENSFIVVYRNGFRLNADGSQSTVQYLGKEKPDEPKKVLANPSEIKPVVTIKSTNKVDHKQNPDTLKKEQNVVVKQFIPRQHAVIPVKSVAHKHILDTITPFSKVEEDSIENDSVDPQIVLNRLKGDDHLGSGVIPVDTLNSDRYPSLPVVGGQLLHVLSLPVLNESLSVIFIILILLVLNFLLIVVFLLINRGYIKRNVNNDNKYRSLYAELIAKYIFDESTNLQIPEPFLNADRDFQKDILIQEMISVVHNVAGDAEVKIKALYFKLELHQYTIRKLNNRKWYKKAQAMRELSAFNVSEAADKVEKYIHHKHPILKQEAILCLVRLRPRNPFDFLDRFNGVFTRWDQLNTYATVKNYKLDIPDFSKWFTSTNPTVVQFAVDMVNANRQTESTSGFERLLNHKYEGVRESVIRAIGEMHLTELSEQLVQSFNKENKKLKSIILDSMSKLGDTLLLNFLSDLVLKNGDLEIRLQAAKALVNVGPLGLMRMQILLLNQDKDVQAIYNHVTDKRI